MKVRLRLTKPQGLYKELEDKTVCGITHNFQGDRTKERFQTIPVAKIPFGHYFLETHPCPPGCNPLLAKVKGPRVIDSQSPNNCCHET